MTKQYAHLPYRPVEDYRRSMDSRKVEQASARLSDLPSAPCFKCEARGWCDHRKPGDI